MNNTIPSVISAMRVLEMLAATPEGASQSRLASGAGLSASTCYRILQSFATQGWALKDTRGARRHGAGLMPVVAALRLQVAGIDAMRRILNDIAAKETIACKISIRSDRQQIVAVRAEPPGEMQATGSEGSRFPVAEGSSGAALLADLPIDDAVALLRATPRSQTDIRFLRSSLADLRKRGWCGRRRIAAWPIAALSAPIRPAGGPIAAALTFLVPDTRFDDPTLPPLLLETARKCELKMEN